MLRGPQPPSAVSRRLLAATDGLTSFLANSLGRLFKLLREAGWSADDVLRSPSLLSFLLLWRTSPAPVGVVADRSLVILVRKMKLMLSATDNDEYIIRIDKAG